jgi:diacylglycerol kinase
MKKITKKIQKLLNSFKCAFEGIFTSIKTEQNMKIHIFVMFFVILIGIFLKISTIEWIICIILFIVVISGEIFNTAIERIVDIIMPYKNENAKIIKDASAGAVLVLAIGAIVIGMLIFFPKILNFIN